MCDINQTQVTQIHLLGFKGLHKLRPLLCILTLLIYLMIVSSNFVIIILVTTVDHLKTPMFIFLKHLATGDVSMTTSIFPVLLNCIFSEEGTLPFLVCIIQMYFVGVFVSLQCFIIAVMSYDRYLAICIPLRYASLMSPKVCLHLVVGTWLLVIVMLSAEIFVLCLASFCGLNDIDHFFCDYGPVVELSTSGTSFLILQDLISCIFLLFLPFSFIVMTYICISFTILKMSSVSGRRKAFSTCSSHLATVFTYYGSLILVYTVPADYSTVNMNKYRALAYIVVTPLLNPIIYSLRNQEIKRALIKLFRGIRN